jgi:hypothetical protein
MATDRSLVHEGPCSCNKGEYKVYSCTPDHPNAKADQHWYEFEVICRDCAINYALEVREAKVYRVKKTDLESKKQQENEWYQKTEEIMEYAKKNGYLEALKKKINSMPSVAATYRLLRKYIYISGTEGTFRRNFSDAEKWIRINIHYWDMPGVVKLLEVKDEKLLEMVKEAEKLAEISREPTPVVEPEICSV